MMTSKVLVFQLGARAHYAVARIAHRHGLLERLDTDICAVRGWPWLARTFLPASMHKGGLKALLARVPKGIPRSRVRAYTAFGWEYARRRRESTTPEATTETHLWAGREFCRLVNRTGLGEATHVYGFNSAALEVLEEAQQRGRVGILEQTIAPRRIVERIMAEERERFPGLERAPKEDPLRERFCEREESEWRLADVIVCGSQFVADGIRDCGGPAAKAVVVPYGVEHPPATAPRPPRDRMQPLRVLYVGEVGLRKGAMYLFEAARRLPSARFEFRLAGPVALQLDKVGPLPTNVNVLGVVPRNEMRNLFAWADVACLPTLCEGSAVSLYEAMGHGLSVVTTPNAGSIVRDGTDGLIVPIRDVEALANALRRMDEEEHWHARSPERLDELARRTSLEAYAEALLPHLGLGTPA